MNKKNIILLIFSILFLIFAIIVFIFATNQNTTSSNLQVSNTTIDETTLTAKETVFNFYDVDENNYTLSDFSDKPIVLILWSSDSTNALDIIELAQEYYSQEEYANSINFLAVNTNEPDSDLQQYILAAGDAFTIPIYYDTDSSAYESYNFSSLPYLVFIDKNGEVSNTLSPNSTGKEITSDSFEANLELLLLDNY